MSNGKVSYLSNSKYSDQIAKAVSDWNAFGSKADLEQAGPGVQPAVVIEDVDDPGLGWVGKYVRGRDGQPAHIYLNRAYLDIGPQPDIQGVAAHEFGHAIGLPDTPGSGGIMGGTSGAAVEGPNEGDRALYDALSSSGAICGQQAPEEQLDPDGPAPISPENPAGCHIMADAPHFRKSTGGVGFKARVFCAVPTTVTATLILRKKGCRFLGWAWCGHEVKTITDTVTTKYPQKAGEFNNLSVQCLNDKTSEYFGVIDNAWYSFGGGVAQMARVPLSVSRFLDCGT